MKQLKNKECKKRYKKKSATKVFQGCISIVNDSLALVLAQHCYCGDTYLKENTCFKENANMAVEKISQ